MFIVSIISLLLHYIIIAFLDVQIYAWVLDITAQVTLKSFIFKKDHSQYSIDYLYHRILNVNTTFFYGFAHKS